MIQNNIYIYIQINPNTKFSRYSVNIYPYVNIASDNENGRLKVQKSQLIKHFSKPITAQMYNAFVHCAKVYDTQTHIKINVA